MKRERQNHVDREALVKTSFQGVAQLSFEHRERAAILLACPDEEGVDLEHVASAARARSVPGAIEWYDKNRDGIVALMMDLLGWAGQEKSDLVRAAERWGPHVCYCVQNAEILKAYCRQNGLKLAGKKKDLQERVFEHLQAARAVPPVAAVWAEGTPHTMQFVVRLETRTAKFDVSSTAMFESALSSVLDLGFGFALDHCYEASLPGDVTLRYSLMRMWSPPRFGRVVYGDETRMSDLQLRKGGQFTLLFDFGDSYRFHFQLADVVAGEQQQEVRLLETSGEMVHQYSVFQEDLLVADNALE